MGKFFDEIPGFLSSWIEKQHMFWTATAPLSGLGHVNLSPKCTRGTFHIENANTVWYEDLTGSGVETISHLKEPGNGRITILFQAFEGPPRICRLFGTGTVHEYGTPKYNELIPPGTRTPSSRAAIVIDVHKVGTSCGYAIPFYEFKSHRNQLYQYGQKWEDADNESLQLSNTISSKGIAKYWKEHNAQSIDGIPGLDSTTAEVVDPFITKKILYTSDDKAMTATAKTAAISGGKRMSGGDRMLYSQVMIGLCLAAMATLMAGHLAQIMLV